MANPLDYFLVVWMSPGLFGESTFLPMKFNSQIGKSFAHFTDYSSLHNNGLYMAAQQNSI